MITQIQYKEAIDIIVAYSEQLKNIEVLIPEKEIDDSTVVDLKQILQSNRAIKAVENCYFDLYGVHKSVFTINDLMFLKSNRLKDYRGFGLVSQFRLDQYISKYLEKL